MIRHILLFRFNDGVSPEVRNDALTRLEGLGEQCPTVHSWSIGANNADSPSAHDIAEVADFIDSQALQQYKDHPAHRELAAHLSSICTWALVDYEFMPDATPETPLATNIPVDPTKKGWVNVGGLLIDPAELDKVREGLTPQANLVDEWARENGIYH